MDINAVLSGGTQNTEQQASLGGFPSSVEPGSGVNNLYNNVTSQQTTQGWTDYRCLYIFNDSEEIRYGVNVSIEYLTEIGAEIQLGLVLQNEVQSIQFSPAPTSGTFKIAIHGFESETITWDSDTSVLAENIQSAIESFTECSVSVPTGGTHLYRITFGGIMGNKSLSSMTVEDSTLTPSPTITIKKVTSGSPINTIAPDTGDQVIAPTGITFFDAITPIVVGKLLPAEGFPLWFKRTVEAGFGNLDEDGFRLHVDQESGDI